MVPVHVPIPQRGNMLPSMTEFTYVIKDLGKERLSWIIQVDLKKSEGPFKRETSGQELQRTLKILPCYFWRWRQGPRKSQKAGMVMYTPKFGGRQVDPWFHSSFDYRESSRSPWATGYLVSKKKNPRDTTRCHQEGRGINYSYFKCMISKTLA